MQLENTTAIAWSPPGHHLAAISATGEVKVWRMASPLIFTPMPLPVSKPFPAQATLAFSQNGQWLAATHGGQVWLWRLLGQTITGEPGLDVRTLGQGLLDRRFDSLAAATVQAEHLAWRPRSPQLAVISGSKLHLWHAQKAMHLATLDLKTTCQGLAWHPAGQVLAIAQKNSVRLWRLALRTEPGQTGGAQRLYFWEMMAICDAIAWSSDGRYLAAASQDCRLALLAWPQVQASGADLATTPTPLGLGGFSSPLQSLAFRPGFDQLVAVDAMGRVHLWQPGWPQPQTGGLDGVTEIAWHPSGQYWATAGPQGQVLAWAWD